ncbi:hypothetical protein EUX98_g6424 [Antrodiella citrinella]|uniref:Fungal-type protein kinase domain-containing protein n=1 Tax=Antrodiella citrinella TaxID=2447956 RepID=A0A4S4MP09_9APHY|nr:hypothetical protein EUX98_g6424 [Antrodiella citrinella]
MKIPHPTLETLSEHVPLSLPTRLAHDVPAAANFDRRFTTDQRLPYVLSMDSLPMNSSRNTPSSASIEQHLKTFLVDKHDENYPIIDFVKSVWGFSPEDIPDRDDGYSLNTAACAHYQIGAYHYDEHGERRDFEVNPPPKAKEHDSYNPLMDIILDLEDQVQEGLAYEDGVRRAELVNMRDRVLDGEFAEMKPDLGWTWTKGKTQSWGLTAVCGEVLKTSTKYYETNGNIDLKKLQPTFTAQEIEETPAPATSEDNTDDAPAGRKRKHRSASAGSQGVRAPKRRRSVAQGQASSSAQPVTTLVSKKRVQTLKYLNELGSHGIRSYATGVLIRNRQMNLWYMDRMGVVESCSFDFMDEPHFLLLVVAAITTAPLSKVGFFPMLRFPHTMSDSEDRSSGGSSDDEEPFESQQFSDHFQNGTLELPPASDTNLNKHSGLIFDLDIGRRRIVNTHGTVGRATIVVPILARSEVAKTHCGKDKLVCKISWHFRVKEGEDVPTEDGCVRAARVALASHSNLKHVVDMKFSVSRTMEEMELPRAFMHDLRDINIRDCRVLILKAYLPLKMVNSPEELKKVFVDAIRGHNTVYNLAHILHRDVSASNIMFHRPDGKSVVGVMCDWDQATPVSQTGSPSEIDGIYQDMFTSRISPKDLQRYGFPAAAQPTSPTTFDSPLAAHSAQGKVPRYRSGTGPFIAIDILSYHNVPIHLYRHDLESFFWVLIWVLASLDPETHELGWIRSWLDTELPKIGAKKKEFLMDTGVSDEVLASSDETYMSYFKDWVRELKRQVYAVQKKHQEFQTEYFEDWRATKDAGKDKQQKKYEKAVRELVEAREKIMTYESFMECLDEDP